jgi:hypothetical protein
MVAGKTWTAWLPDSARPRTFNGAPACPHLARVLSCCQLLYCAVCTRKSLYYNDAADEFQTYSKSAVCHMRRKHVQPPDFFPDFPVHECPRPEHLRQPKLRYSALQVKLPTHFREIF